MAADAELHLLRAADPAAELSPLAEHARLSLRDEAMSGARAPARRRATSARRAVRISLALVVLTVVGVGAAWAATGGPSPLALFETNPQGRMQVGVAGPSYWDQTVIPGSVKQAASVDIPKVGPVAFWYADTNQGGWCAGLRLSNGDWLGTGASPLDNGGVVPGCFPTQASVIDGPDHVTNVAHGFDWETSYVDARSVGGRQWDIRFGKITAPGAVKVTDVVSGASTDVVDGDLFMLLVPEPNPPASTPNEYPPIDLVAYDNAGNVVADSCPYCVGR